MTHTTTNITKHLISLITCVTTTVQSNATTITKIVPFSQYILIVFWEIVVVASPWEPVQFLNLSKMKLYTMRQGWESLVTSQITSTMTGLLLLTLITVWSETVIKCAWRTALSFSSLLTSMSSFNARGWDAIAGII